MRYSSSLNKRQSCQLSYLNAPAKFLTGVFFVQIYVFHTGSDCFDENAWTLIGVVACADETLDISQLRNKTKSKCECLSTIGFQFICLHCFVIIYPIYTPHHGTVFQTATTHVSKMQGAAIQSIALAVNRVFHVGSQKAPDKSTMRSRHAFMLALDGLL